MNRCNSINSLKLTIGDLMSGRAFDNNCNCLDKQSQIHKQHSSYLYSSSTSGLLINSNKHQNGKIFFQCFYKLNPKCLPYSKIIL